MFWISSTQRDIYNNKSLKLNSKNKLQTKFILVPFLEDAGTMKVIHQILNNLSLRNNLEIKYFYIHTSFENKNLNNINNKISYKIHSLLRFNRIRLFKYSLIYKVNHFRIKFTNYNHIFYNHLQNKFANKEEVLNYYYKNICIGDLIYDTQLRFFSTPTLLLNDELTRITNYSKVLVDYWNNIFNKNHFDIILLPYTSYIQWGIPARTAIDKGLNVVTFGNPNYYFQEINKDYLFHSKNFLLYKKIWNQLNNKNQLLSISKNRFEERFKGNLADLSYMNKSAYSSGYYFQKKNPTKPFFVIFLHCFFDSPHIYGSGLFPDFYEWLNFILNTATTNTNCDFYIKPHPNALPGNKEIVDKFLLKFRMEKNIHFLSDNIDNISIINNKPNAIFTFYGTIASEFAYYDIPVIMAGDSPYNNYSFVHQPKTLFEFEYFITTNDKIELPKNHNKSEILEFYYMHYIYYSKNYNAIDNPKIINLESGKFKQPINSLTELILN